MRRLAMTIIFASLTCPAAAIAGTPVTSFTTAQEKGVTIYRGQTSDHNYQIMSLIQQSRALREEHAKINAKLSTQDRELAAQRRDIDALKARQEKDAVTSEPKRRGRFGRTFAGNNRFFGANGFIGNSNFSGATQPLPRRQHRSYRRKHR